MPRPDMSSRWGSSQIIRSLSHSLRCGLQIYHRLRRLVDPFYSEEIGDDAIS